MYKRVRLKDTVEVPPEELGDVSPNRVKRLLQDKLEGRMDEEVGSIVSVTNVHDIGEGTVLPNRPGVYYEAEFDAVTFDPQMQEVVDGTVVEVVEFGAFVGIGPVDGLLHVSQISDEYRLRRREPATRLERVRPLARRRRRRPGPHRHQEHRRAQPA